MNKTVLLIALILCFAGCSEHKVPEQAAQEKGNDVVNATTQDKSQKAIALFVPGNRLGDIVLGKTSTEELADSLGTPISGDAAMGKAESTYALKDHGHQALLTVFASRYTGGEEHKTYLVEAIRTTSSRYQSANGLGVGSSLQNIRVDYDLTLLGSFTENDQPYKLYDTPDGVAFEIGDNDTCHGIMIHDPKDMATNTYLPMYADFSYKKAN